MASSSSSSLHVPSQINPELTSVEQIRREEDETYNELMINRKRRTEDILRKVLETDLKIENALLHLFADEAVNKMEKKYLLSALGYAEQEVHAWDVLETIESIELARTTVEGMKVGRSWMEEEDKECPICMKEFKAARVTPCSHWFHSRCLFKWLSGSIGSNSGSCPICRFNLLPISPNSSDYAADQ